jgi:hypothetical protein
MKGPGVLTRGRNRAVDWNVGPNGPALDLRRDHPIHEARPRQARGEADLEAAFSCAEVDSREEDNDNQ